ncbi:phytoene desaturase family protein [Auraticoccus monumenti]|uniref:Phytoene desaturase n=1 Tax=Auraticoccus monumenti TaxID=675864 RepID=A0A1G6VMC7_9ACTN|nr:phytoene desaturase family protein [Auraticoccus monumenti]SDD54006.1 phytoene desaturase [Auraticoccus monumenti]
MPAPVIVVGAGLAGLATACRLAGAGHQVTVLEREPIPGGRGGRIRDQGFSFDTGPTVMTMPSLVADTLAAAGSELDELLPMRKLDPAYQAQYADGSRIRVRSGHAEMRAEIASTSGEHDARGFDDFVSWLGELYDVEMDNFIDRNFDSPVDLVTRPLVAARLLRLGGFGRLGPAVRRFFDDDRLQKLFSFQAMYAGLPPETALALYAVITYMDSIAGVYVPEGGMHAVPTALATAAERAGVTFRYGVDVADVLGSGGKVAGVRLSDGEVLRADAVVLTPDLPVAYRAFFPELTPPWGVRHGTYSPSAVVWHVGVRGGLPADRVHHNIHFGEQWNEAFEALIRRRELMPDPSRLVTVPSATDPSLAPEGCSTLYVLEPVPNLSGDVDWSVETDRMRERLLGFLDREGYPTDVVTEELFTPVTWRHLGMEQGTPFALAHTMRQTGPFRPGNVEPRRPGVFFAGSGTVPGVGVPMVLISGKLAAERVDAWLGKR